MSRTAWTIHSPVIYGLLRPGRRGCSGEIKIMENDPDEVNNLAESPNYAKVLGEPKEKLKAFQKRTKDPWIVKWQYE
jgi:hypothetical protein